ncbi:MAG: hypothetical protein AAF682_19770 [Planctomycetota bacterium]
MKLCAVLIFAITIAPAQPLIAANIAHANAGVPQPSVPTAGESRENAFPTAEAIQHLYRSLDVEGLAPVGEFTIQPIGNEMMSVGTLAHSLDPGASLGLVLKRDVYAQQGSAWHHAVDLDLEYGVDATRSTGELNIGFRADAAELFEGSSSYAQLAGWSFRHRAEIDFGVNLQNLVPLLKRADDPAAFMPLLAGAAQSFERESTVTDPSGFSATVSGEDATWADALAELYRTSPADVGTAAPGDLMDCIDDCFGQIGKYISYAGLLCLAIGLIACGVSGPGWPICAKGVLAACGIFTALGDLEVLLVCLLVCVTG